MSQPAALAPTGPIALSQRLGVFIARLNLRLGFLRFVALSNGLILVALLVMLFIPDSPLGIMRFLQEDTGIPRDVLVACLAALFVMDISQSLRGAAGLTMAVFALSGQMLMALITVFYVVQGDVSLAGVFGYVGFPMLNIIGIATIAQSYAPSAGFQAKRLIYPAISLLMAALTWGLITRPDGAMTRFIQGRYGLALFFVMIALLAWGAGQLRHNHLAPDRMARRLLGVYLYVFMSIGLFIQDNSISFLGLVMNGLTACVMVFFAFMQAQDYAGT